MARGIYLDNSMTTRPSEKAIGRMLNFYSNLWGSPSAPHQMGQELFPSIEESLRNIYRLIGASDADDIIFTSSGAEAVNHAIMSTYYEITRSTGKNQFITSHIDEAPAIMTIGRLETLGCVGKMVKANHEGKITVKAIADALTPRTAMVSISWANGLTGVINPVAEIASLCKDRGVLLHLDATHVLGRLFFDLNDFPVQFISFNGDHIHAPKGTGGLYIKEGTKYSSFILGGLEQAGRRAGSLNVPGLVALGEAASEASLSRDFVCTEVARLRNHFEKGILAAYKDALPLFQDQERLPHCTTIAFSGISNEALLYALNRKNIFASIGGGCFQKIDLLLAACGVREDLANSSISFSLSRETTEDEIDRAIDIIGETANRMRKASLKII